MQGCHSNMGQEASRRAQEGSTLVALMAFARSIQSLSSPGSSLDRLSAVPSSEPSNSMRCSICRKK